MSKENRIDDYTEPWKDQFGKIITLEDCINACYLAGSLFLKETEFNPRIKDNPIAKAEYERSRIIMVKLRDNYERALKIMREHKPKKLIPKEKT